MINYPQYEGFLMRKKIIKVTLTLTDGIEYFTAEGDNKASSTGFAISCVTTYGNGAITPTAQIVIYGLPIETMNKLFRVQWNTMQAIMNTVKIEAGEQGGELHEVYEGNITFATINMAAAPDVSLIITSQVAIVERMKATPPYVLAKGESTSVAEIVRYHAADSGYEFENYGVDKIVTDLTLNGSNIEKIEKLAQMCDFDLYIEPKRVAICKKGEAIPIKVPVISPNTGLIGYPNPSIRGVDFLCIYDPMVRFGGIVTIKDSLIEIANTDWRIFGLVSTLEANIPNGKWESSVNATWRNSKDAAVQR